jgi:nucleoid-associated protein EbfC
MFDKLKAMGQMAALLKDKERLRESAQRIKLRAAEVRAEGQAGSGAVRVTVDGTMKVLKVEMMPALVAGMAADEKTRELAGSLIADAVNEAIKLAQDKMKVIMSEEAREMGLPDLPGDIGGLLS